ncbi:AbiJ-NTD4 domain-containing protein [Maritalea sp. S77]|uniref:AbiJ-NTD4 domain-containing protein n=1 Tax=Maritalea sp. S77 TaxID=3415125 RepID=UPI003C7D9A0B
MSDEISNLSFSQRNGLQAIPQQLELGKVSPDFRRLVDYAINREIERVRSAGSIGYYFVGSWKVVAQDIHVKFFGNRISTYDNSAYKLNQALEEFTQNKAYNRLFDLIEFLANHKNCTDKLKDDLASAFVEGHLAYRLIEKRVVAVGTNEQADALLRAIDKTELSGNLGARKHLLEAGQKIAIEDWVGSVHESIHAVEAMAKSIAPGGTLGNALKQLEKQGTLNQRLKDAFSKLYGYTNDDKTGVRHANVFGTEDTVSEADALFMLGACASFVSYLIAKSE